MSTILRNYEFIQSFNDFQRNSSWGAGVVLSGSVIDKDWQIYNQRTSARKAYGVPLVGDVVRAPSGELWIISHDHGERVQLSTGGSLHLHYSGKMGFSGGLDSAVSKDKLVKQGGDSRYVRCWFFSEDERGAHRGCYTIAPVAVYELKEHGGCPREYLTVTEE